MWVPVPQFAHLQNRYVNHTWLPPQGLASLTLLLSVSWSLEDLGYCETHLDNDWKVV